MNYDEVAKKVASDHFAREQRGECPIAGKLVSAIAAALRRASNEAAWDGYFMGHMYQKTHSLGVERQIEDEMNAKYGMHQKDTRNG